MKRELLNDDNLRSLLCKQYPVEYEFAPHPFRSSAISEAVNSEVDTGVNDEAVCWVGYDWCGNPVGVAEKDFIPLPNIVPENGERITIQRYGGEWIYMVGSIDEIYEYHKSKSGGAT